ncbi:MAG: glucokinase [Spirochaetia bacterium]
MMDLKTLKKPFNRKEGIEYWDRNKNDSRIILTGDIGGTNSRFAMIGITDDEFVLLHKKVYTSSELSGVEEGITRFLDSAEEEKKIAPDSAALSAAGPVKNNVCTLSNLHWEIDGDKVGDRFGFPVLVINDFMGMSYGIPFLDPHNPEHLTVIRRPDGKEPEPAGPVSAIIGAGTGLGVGLLADTGSRYLAFPSEGGHADYSSWDRETDALKDSVEDTEGFQVESEHFISGAGITRIYESVTGKKTGMKPAEIAEAGKTDPQARKAMDLFIRSYGRFSGNAALFFLPYGGLFLGGGIVTKNIPFFLENHAFIRAFEHTERPKMRQLLSNIPVYIIKDYSVTLFGASYALLSSGSPLQGAKHG